MAVRLRDAIMAMPWGGARMQVAPWNVVRACVLTRGSAM